MKKIFNVKRIIVLVLLIAIAICSIFKISDIASSPEFHKNSIKILDDKKMTVMELTAASVLVSTTISAIPGDATTPLANQIMQMSVYLLIITGVIYLEKILLTLTGVVAFKFLIPISCGLIAIYIFYRNDKIKNLAIKLTVFSLVIFTVVPASVYISSWIENNYQETINQTIESAQNIESISEEENDSTEEEEKGFFKNFIDKAQSTISNLGNNVSALIEKGKMTLSNFIDAIAVLIITSCVIPIFVMIFIMWIVKIIFGINIPERVKKVHNDWKKDKLQEVDKNDIK